MSNFMNSLYGKIAAIFLVVLLGLGAVQILISVNSSLDFVRESDQQLNRKLAHDLAKEFKPFLEDSLDSGGIEHKIHELMVMNPRIEIYLLDRVGKVLAYFIDHGKTVKRDSVSLDPVIDFLLDRRQLPILGDDPRHAGRQKPFFLVRGGPR